MKVCWPIDAMFVAFYSSIEVHEIVCVHEFERHRFGRREDCNLFFIICR